MFFRKEIFYKQGVKGFHQYESSGIDERARMASSPVLQKSVHLAAGMAEPWYNFIAIARVVNTCYVPGIQQCIHREQRAVN